MTWLTLHVSIPCRLRLGLYARLLCPLSARRCVLLGAVSLLDVGVVLPIVVGAAGACAQEEVAVRQMIITIALFSLATPTGIAVGIALSEALAGATAGLWAASLLQAAAAGTFICVATMEVILEEFPGRSRQDVLVNVAALLLGITIMAAL